MSEKKSDKIFDLKKKKNKTSLTFYKFPPKYKY